MFRIFNVQSVACDLTLVNPLSSWQHLATTVPYHSLSAGTPLQGGNVVVHSSLVDHRGLMYGWATLGVHLLSARGKSFWSILPRQIQLNSDVICDIITFASRARY